jgi:hypothetical protein
VIPGGGAEKLVARLVTVITVTGGRRGGDPETRVQLDHLMPSPDALDGGTARWHLLTSGKRLFPPPVSREPLQVWHAADGSKGRRLLAADLSRQDQIAAILSWHFESSGPRPHLVTSAAVRLGIPPRRRVEYLVALWLLLCAALAIDRVTVQRGHIGVVLDNAIELDAAELATLGLVRGSSRRGYRGDYFVLAPSSR